jgi:hypothetical protein
MNLVVTSSMSIDITYDLPSLVGSSVGEIKGDRGDF